MYILFDTNVWVSELALNSNAGSAVRFYVQQRAATVVLPEVVRLEVKYNLTKLLRTATEKVVQGHRQLLAVFGQLKDVVVPTPVEIDSTVEEVLGSLDVPTMHLPFSLEAAHSALVRTIEKTPPSDRSQQFKDAVIWAHCLELLGRDEVYLVTRDKDFYIRTIPRALRRRSGAR